MFNLEAVVQAAEELEPMPASISRLAVVVADPESSSRDVIDLVSYDQALTVTVLRYANSAASAPRSPIVTVAHAVLRLGGSQVLSAALASTVERSMLEPVPAYHLAAGELWHTAMLGALAAEVLIDYSTLHVPPETVSAALLADIGKVVLSRCLDQETLEYLQRAEKEGHQSRHQAELEMLGAHHGEIGALVAQHWALPQGIVTGILYHHTPEDSDELVAYATSLSCAVADMVLAGLAGAEDVPSLPEWMEKIGIVSEDIPRLCEATSARYDELNAKV